MIFPAYTVNNESILDGPVAYNNEEKSIPFYQI